MNLKFGKVLTSKSVGTGASSYEKRVYRAAVSQGTETLFYTAELPRQREVMTSL